MNGLAPRERRLVALGLLVLAVALVWAIVVRPIVDGFADRDAERTELLANYARGERIVGAMRATRAALRAQKARAGDFAIAAPGAPLAADLLRERVLRTARAARVTVLGVQEAQTTPGRVAVRADLTVPPERLAPLIAAFEAQPPWLTVEQLNVSADRALERNRSSPVDVRIDLSTGFDVRAAR